MAVLYCYAFHACMVHWKNVKHTCVYIYNMSRPMRKGPLWLKNSKLIFWWILIGNNIKKSQLKFGWDIHHIYWNIKMTLQNWRYDIANMTPKRFQISVILHDVLDMWCPWNTRGHVVRCVCGGILAAPCWVQLAISPEVDCQIFGSHW
jgi:hypothetical protein